MKSRRPRVRRPGRAEPHATRPLASESFIGEVRDLASDGRGVVAGPGGLSVFVAGVWPGERGRFQLLRRQRNFGEAKLLELLQPAAVRVAPVCPHHGFGPGCCGGCPWQFVDYAAQLEAKQRRVERALARLGVDCVAPIEAAAEGFGYRNRAQFKTDGQSLGYVGAGSRELAPIGQCPILTPTNQLHLSTLLASLPNPAWRPARRSNWTRLNIDDALALDDVRIDQRLPFRQSNSAQNDYMRDWLARRSGGCDLSAPVLELFCGSGNFTGVLVAAGFAEIVAVDAVGEATAALAAARLPGVAVKTLDLFAPGVFERLYAEIRPPATLVLDPPRAGLKNRQGVLAGPDGPRDILYISCDLASFARDLDFFQRAGFAVIEVQPLDLAPQTPHVELLAHLRRG